MAPKIVDKDMKRAEILVSAFSVFAKKGFNNTRIEDISEEAGIAKGTVYQYFKNKDDLFLALSEHLLKKFREKIFSGVHEELTAPEALSKFIVQTLKTFEEWQEFGFVLLDSWSEQRRARNRQFKFSDIYKISRSAITEIIQKGVRKGELAVEDPLLAASIVIAILDGIMLQRIFDSDLFHEPNYEDKIVSMVFKALEKK